MMRRRHPRKPRRDEPPSRTCRRPAQDSGLSASPRRRWSQADRADDPSGGTSGTGRSPVEREGRPTRRGRCRTDHHERRADREARGRTPSRHDGHASGVHVLPRRRVGARRLSDARTSRARARGGIGRDRGIRRVRSLARGALPGRHQSGLRRDLVGGRPMATRSASTAADWRSPATVSAETWPPSSR